MSKEMERRRKTDKFGIGAAILAALALIVSVVVAYTTLNNRSDLLNQNEGRRLALSISCAVYTAIIDSGEEALKSGVLLPGDRVRNGHYEPGPLAQQLKKTVPDYPSFAERVAVADLAAKAYRDRIARAVIDASRRVGNDTIPLDKDGSLSCDKYKDIVTQ